VTLLIDVTAVLLIFVNGVVGWRFGVIGRCLALAGLYGGVAAATFLGNGVADYVHGRGSSNALYASAWAYVAILAVVVILVEILVALYGEHLRAITSLVFNRTAGLVVGAVVGFLEIAVVCLVALSVGNAPQVDPGQLLPGDRTNLADAVRGGILGGRILSVEPGVQDLFSPVLPADLSGHLAELSSP
jgi:uncharacterized membrane protein required for colicin V production